MQYEYLPEEYRGNFRCNDEELNRIWEVGAYTMHLTTREFFIDGIKRDRWVWSGDAIQSYLMNYYLFFDNESVKRTIWLLRGKDPVTSHSNTIMDLLSTGSLAYMTIICIVATAILSTNCIHVCKQ